jgi:hypothetical protein
MSVALRDLERRMPEPDRELAQRILAEVAPAARRRRRWAPALAIGLLLIAGVIAGGLLRRAAERHPPVAPTPSVRHGQPPLRGASEVPSYSTAGLQLFDLNSLRRRPFITKAEMGGSQVEVGRWSPANDRFAFATARGCEEPCAGAGLYIKDGGRPARRVPSGGYPSAWAPDGSALLVEVPPGGLAVIDPETLAARAVPAGPHGWEAGAAWIDDGRAFLALRRDNDGGSTLERIDRATLAATPVAPPNHFACAMLSGAPDGNSAALVRRTGACENAPAVELIDRDGRRRTVGNLPLGTAYGPQLAWSPDGRMLAVDGATGSRAEQGAIWVVDLPSAQARRLVTLPSRAWETSIRWLPGTRGIAVLPLEGRAYAVTLAGRTHALPRIVAYNVTSEGP